MNSHKELVRTVRKALFVAPVITTTGIALALGAVSPVGAQTYNSPIITASGESLQITHHEAITVPVDVTLSPGVTVPVDVTLPPGATITGDITLSPGATASGDATLPPGVIISGDITLPPGVTIPGDVTLPPGVTIPGDVTLPPGFTVPGDATVMLPPGATVNTGIIASSNGGAVVGAIVDAARTSGAPAEFILPLLAIDNATEARIFVDAIDGATHANALQATIFTSQLVNQAIQQRFDGGLSAPAGGGASADASAGDRSLWVQGLGNWGDGDGDENAAGFDQTTGGIAFGFDYQLSAENLVGVMGAYLDDEVEFDRGLGETDIETWQIGLYGQHDQQSWYLNGILTYGWSDYDSKRPIPYFNRIDTAKGDYDGTTFVAYGEAGYKYDAGNGIMVKPMLGLGYVNSDTDGFTETGTSPYNLRVGGGSGDSFTSNLGIRASIERTTGGGTPIRGDARLIWQHEFNDDYQSIDASFVTLPTASFGAKGSTFSRDSAIVGLGITARVAPQGELFLNWNGRFGGDYTSNAIFGGGRYTW